MTEVIKSTNSSMVSIIRNMINNHNFHLILLKDKIDSITSNDFTYQDLKDLNPNILVIQKMENVKMNIKLAYDTEDELNYDIKYQDVNETPIKERYLKLVDVNDNISMVDVIENHRASHYWLYISYAIQWGDIPSDIMSDTEDEYSTIILSDLYDSSNTYMNVLPEDGILYSYQYDNTDGVVYNFSKNSSFKDVFEFYIKFKLGETCEVV